MTKNEFLSRLADELKKNKIIDAADIISEYEQHFAFKLADGFSEEEIAAKLGNPAELAAQFAGGSDEIIQRGRKTVAVIGLSIIDLLAGAFFILLMAWEVVMAVFSLSNAVIAICLFSGTNLGTLIPSMPYWCGVVFALSLAGLSVLTAVGCIFFAAFIRQLMRSYSRFRRNTIAAVSGSALLPSVAIHPQLPAKLKRRIRSVALFSLALFAACFVLGAILSMIAAGAIEFWHAWGWFGYSPVN